MAFEEALVVLCHRQDHDVSMKTVPRMARRAGNGSDTTGQEIGMSWLVAGMCPALRSAMVMRWPLAGSPRWSCMWAG